MNCLKYPVIALVVLAAAIPANAQTTVFINEIHYDNAGADTGEAIEIAGPAGTDLSGWSLELYNGNGGASYGTIPLSGSIIDSCGGYGVVFTSVTGLQNGSPDGIALVDNSGSVVQFLSYEGSFDAVGGPADAMTSTDIGVAEAGSTPVGSSVQLTGTGFTYEDFAWTGPTAENFGSCNTGQSFGEPPSRLLINEIDYDQPGTDTAEFIEIKNASASPVDLGAYSLVLVNGSTGSVYRTIALPATTLASGDYFVVCGDDSNVTDCDLDVSPDSNLVQNGSPDAVALTLEGAVVDAVSYEGDTIAPYTEGSGSGLVDTGSAGDEYKGISRFPDGFDSDQNNSDFRFSCITPGAPNTSAGTGCGPAGQLLEIHEIQGSGASSPYEGSPVTTENNIVTAVGLNGFFIQAPAERSDADPSTSEGIFVFTGSPPPAVSAGELVNVSGTVAEFFGLTEISNGPTVTVTGTGTVPDPVALDANLPSGLPADPPELESLEGMLVSASGVATGPSDRFGDIPVVARTTRSFRETGIEHPGLPGLPVWDGNPEIFDLDPDGLGLPDFEMFAGQEFEAVGPLGFAFGDYQLLPTSLAPGPAPALPAPVRDPEPGEFTVASLNLFRLVNSDVATRAPKISTYIRFSLKAPDILAVQEVDAIGTLEALAAQVASDDPSLVYTAYLLEGNDPGGIDVGYLVRDTVSVYSVTQFGEDLEFFFNGRWWDTFDRPPLVLDAEYVGQGDPFPIVVIANHLRSLSAIDDPTSLARPKRYEQAYQLSHFIQSLQLTNPEAPLVVTGDFNSFEFTDGYVDVMGQITGNLDPLGALLPGSDEVEPDLVNQTVTLPQAERYSFVFEGSAQAFDHMLTAQSIAPVVQGVEYARGNADAPVNMFSDDGTPLRAADHDGVVLYVLADSDFDGVPNYLDACSDTTIPEGVPTQELGTNRWALVDDDGIFDTKAPKGNGPKDSFTIEDTAGCSCEQIIEELHLGNGHTKFGCSTGVMKIWVREVQP